MEKNLFIDLKPHDENSDSLSTSAASYAQVPFEEADTSPSNGNSSSSPDADVQEKSKKIRKKRNAYQKIDDDIRLGLLEAVQRGETLKSAAKRYQVNYSSAKSIFHIFRKEGRILKKITQEKNVGFDLPIGQEIELPTQYLTNCNIAPMETLYQRPQAQEFKPERAYSPMNAAVGCSSPLNGLVDNFSDLLKIENNMKAKSYIPTCPSRFNPKASSMDYNIPKMQANQPTMCFAAKAGVNPVNRPIDNFYMNYSNSPLSGNANMGSGTGSNRSMKGDCGSFTDMLGAFQNQNLLAASLKETAIPKLIMPGMGSAEKFEEEITWGGALENAARDTYKSFLDAQMVLNNAFRKASLLNNLVQIHKTGSPRFLSFQGN